MSSFSLHRSLCIATVILFNSMLMSTAFAVNNNSVVAQSLSPCIQAFDDNKNDQLLSLCSEEVKQGSYVAALLLANLLVADNPRLSKDPAQAYRLYAKAAELAAAKRTEPKAQWVLGVLSLDGRGTRRDPNFGVGQLWQAAKMDYVPALRQLGLVYAHGISTRYAYGPDIRKDPEKAFRYFLRAASLGDVIAQQQLAAAYVTGSGTAVDLIKAYSWYAVLTSGGDEYGRQQKIKLARKLNAGQIARAEAMGKQFLNACGTGKQLYDY